LKAYLYNLEKQYQHLNIILEGNATDGFKVLCVLEFLSPLISDKRQNMFTSYYLELCPIFTDLISKNNFEFFSSDSIRNIKSLIAELRKNIFLDSFKTAFQNAELKLENIGSNVHQTVSQDLKSNSLAIVLLEQTEDIFFKNVKYGTIEELNISSSQRGKTENTDYIEFKNNINAKDNEFIKFLYFTVSQVKKKFPDGKLKTNFYNFTFYFNNRDHVYSGKSLGLGAACLVYNVILSNELYKQYFKFRNECVFTGEIDEEGKIKKLDYEILRIKLKTVFNSGYSKFIIPDGNLSEATAELRKLNEENPSRNLELIPISNFESVFLNLAVVERFETSLAKKIKFFYLEKHFLVNIVLIAIILLTFSIIFIKLLQPLFDNNPVHARYHNGRYSAYNKFESEVWHYNVPGVSTYKDPRLFTNQLDHVITVKDIDNDGENEIIYINNIGNSNITLNNEIKCESANGTLKWVYTIPDTNFSYRKGTEALKGDWEIDYLYADDIDKDGIVEILLNAKFHPYFPDRIILLNNMGKRISEYWHSGHIHHIKVFDIDNDGIREIVATGINNHPKYLCACMAILDVKHISGSSFMTDPLNNGEKSKEKYYVLFPKTFLTKFNAYNFNRGSEILDNLNRTIVEIKDGKANDDPDKDATFLYEFDKNLELKNIAGSTSFYNEYMERSEKGEIEKIPDIVDYLNSLKSKLLWWDGDEFQTKIVKNKYFGQ